MLYKLLTIVCAVRLLDMNVNGGYPMKPQIFSWLNIPDAPAGIFVTLAAFILLALPLFILPAQPARAGPRAAPNPEIIVNSSLDTP